MTRNSVWLSLMLMACSGGAGTEVQQRVVAPVPPGGWTQFGGDHAKGGVQFPGPGPGLQVVKVITVDPGADAYEAENGFYQAHQPQPVTAGEWVYVPRVDGFTGVETKETQTYHVDAYRWIVGIGGRALIKQWSHASTWTSMSGLRPGGFSTPANGHDPLFQPAVSGDSLYVPEFGGAVARLDRVTGAVQATLAPPGTPADDHTMVNSSIAVDQRGRVYWTVVAWPIGGLFSDTQRGSWLVRADGDQLTVVPWGQIAVRPTVPGPGELCDFMFNTPGTPPVPTPLPPSPTATPPQGRCGLQRPPVNVPPSFFSNGDLAVSSVGNSQNRNGFIIRLDGDTLAPIWTADVRGHILHGCGVLIPYGTRRSDCRAGTTFGFQPEFNQPFAWQGQDIVESHLVVDPDDGVTLCGYLGGLVFGGRMDARGSCLRFASDGSHAATSEYGWEVTPAVRRHADGWSFVADRNRFSDGDQAVVSMTPSFVEEWAANTGEVGGDFTENLNGQLAVDATGNAYGIDADGIVTKYGPDGAILEQLDLGTGLRITLSTELSLGPDGTLYVPFVGTLYVITGGGPALAAASKGSDMALAAGVRATRPRLKGDGEDRLIPIR